MKRGLVIVCITLLVCLNSVLLYGADKVWTGASSTYWSDGGNWVGGAPPVSGDTIVYNSQSTGNLQLQNNDISGLENMSFEVTDVGNWVGVSIGNSIGLASGTAIDMTAAGNSLKLTPTLSLSGATTFFAQSLTASDLSLGSNTLTVEGITLQLFYATGSGGIVVNTSLSFVNEYLAYTGPTQINNPLVLNISSGLPDTSAVSIGASGDFNLNSNDDTIGSLAGSGEVDLGSGALTTGGDNTSTTYSGVISGTGSLTKAGTGTMTLSGANTYSGGTTISGGTLKLGASDRINDTGALTITSGTFDLNDFSETIGSLSGSGSVTLGSGTLTTGGNDTDTTYSGVISGTGALVKEGSGKMTLSGNNTYSGVTTVSGGTLDVSGEIGDVTINSDGTLCGTGSVEDVTNSGTIAPGNSIGTLTVTGNYTHEAGSIYQVEVDADGNSDLIDVTGTATINGGTVDVRAESGSYALSTDYTILQAAGGVTGTFDTVTSNLAFLDPSLSYNASSVLLTLTRNDTDFESIGKSLNERAVGNALDRITSTATGDMTTVINTLLGLSAPDARAAYNQMGGAVFTALARTGSSRVVRSFRKIGKIARVSSTFRGVTGGSGNGEGVTRLALAEGITMTDGGPLLSSLGGGLQSPPDTGWNLWVTGNGTSGWGKGDDIASQYKYTINGINAGFDKLVTDRLLAGISFGVSDTDISYNDLTDCAGNETIQGTLYGFYDRDPWYINGVLLCGVSDYETDRHISFGGIERTAHADYDGSEIGGSIEAGYRIERKTLLLEPCASLELSRLSQDRFTETGADSLNLTVDSQETRSARSSVGLRLSRRIKSRNGVDLKPEGSLHWAHEFSGDDNMIDSRFSGYPSGSYTVRGEKPDRNSAVCKLGVTGTIRERLSLSFHLDAEAGRNHHVAAATAKIAYRW